MGNPNEIVEISEYLLRGKHNYNRGKMLLGDQQSEMIFKNSDSMIKLVSDVWAICKNLITLGYNNNTVNRLKHASNLSTGANT